MRVVVRVLLIVLAAQWLGGCAGLFYSEHWEEERRRQNDRYSQRSGSRHAESSAPRPPAGETTNPQAEQEVRRAGEPTESQPRGYTESVPQHVVRRGDTMYSVAWRYGLDYRQLASWNGIQAPYLIYPGQRIDLQPTGRVSEPVVAEAPPPPQPKPPVWPTSPVPQQPQPPSEPASTPSPAAGAGWEVVENERPVRARPPETEAQNTASLPPPPVSPIPRPPRGTGTPPDAVVVPPPVATGTSGPGNAAGETRPVSISPPKSSRPEPNIVALKTRKKDGLNWNWPTEGSILNKYNPKKGSTAVDIAIPLGTPVRAASNGTVVYSGGGLKGYGQLLIVKHNNDYLSAYAFNTQILVQQGDQVRAGQLIARSGQGPSRKPMLRFEVRKKGKAVDPLNLLPST